MTCAVDAATPLPEALFLADFWGRSRHGGGQGGGDVGGTASARPPAAAGALETPAVTPSGPSGPGAGCG